MMQQKHGYIRSIDIAEQLGVTKPSVTYTTKRLRENGYITMDRDGLITLIENAGATVVGAGIAVEKAFQPGGARIRARGYRVESLARVQSMDPETGIVFC